MFPSALVVTEDLAELARLTEWLEGAGYMVVACPGPRLRDRCPVQNGERCVLREAVDVAVVGLRSMNGPGRQPKRQKMRCTTLPDDGTTILFDESGIQTTIGDRKERVGPLTQTALAEAVGLVRSRTEHPSQRSGGAGGGRWAFPGRGLRPSCRKFDSGTLRDGSYPGERGLRCTSPTARRGR